MPSNLLKTIFMVSILVVTLTGCMSLSPRVSPDRIEYINDISESWKKQMLLNIVKLRYFDPPTFLEVSSIINQYGVERQANIGSGWDWPSSDNAVYGLNAEVGGYSRYSDKPTVTYTPLSGQKFTKNLLTPIPPTAIVSLIQGGWATDVVFSLTVKTINGVRNGFFGGGSTMENNDFSRLVSALRKVQLAGVTDIRVEKVNDRDTVLFVISDAATKEMFAQESQDMRRILKVKPDINSYKIVYGSLAANDEEIALLTRSMLEIMFEMASKVDVPQRHIVDKRVNATVPFFDSGLVTRIHSGKDKPQDTFAAVRYQDYWFWVDNKDIVSKRNFALLMIFMSLTESEQKSSGPLLTIGN